MDCALMSLQKSFCPTLNPEDFFFQKDLQFQILHMDVWSILQFSSNFCIRCEIQAKIQLFAQEYPIVPKSFVHKTIITPLNCHCTLAKQSNFSTFPHPPNFIETFLNYIAPLILFIITIWLSLPFTDVFFDKSEHVITGSMGITVHPTLAQYFSNITRIFRPRFLKFSPELFERALQQKARIFSSCPETGIQLGPVYGQRQ